MFAVPLGLFATRVPDELRPRAFGINAAMWGVSALVGPLLGAILTSTVGWRWVFWVNLPLIAIVAWAARLALAAQAPRRPRGRARRRINLDRAAAARRDRGARCWRRHTTRSRSSVLTPSRGPRPPWPSSGTSGARQTRCSRTRPTAIAANVAAFAAGVVFLGAETYLPLQLQVGFHHGVAVVGIALLLCTVGLVERLDGRGAASTWAPNPRCMLGSAMVVVTAVVMALPFGGAPLVIIAYAVRGARYGHREPGAVRGGARRQGGGPGGPGDLDDSADPPDRLGRRRGGRGHRVCRGAHRRTRSRRPSTSGRTCPRWSARPG